MIVPWELYILKISHHYQIKFSFYIRIICFDVCSKGIAIVGVIYQVYISNFEATLGEKLWESLPFDL